MSEERLQILRMVAEGKVSPEEAARLLEAVEVAPSRPAGPPPAHLRVKVAENGKVKSFSVGVGLAEWVLNLVGSIAGTATGQRFDPGIVAGAIKRGETGKVFEADEDQSHVEIWLEP